MEREILGRTPNDIMLRTMIRPSIAVWCDCASKFRCNVDDCAVPLAIFFHLIDKSFKICIELLL
jgi:hypothetical protein